METHVLERAIVEETNDQKPLSQWMPLDEAATELGVVRGTVYHYLRQLKLKTKKFPLDRHTYISRSTYAKIVAARKAARTRQH